MMWMCAKIPGAPKTSSVATIFFKYRFGGLLKPWFTVEKIFMESTLNQWECAGPNI